MRASRAFVALGDSITAAEDSWAAILARALGLPLVNLAQDGQVAAGMAREQLPRVPAGPLALAAVYIGVNDARSTAWDAEGYDAALRRALAVLGERAGRLLVLTVPEDLGRPVAGPDAFECAGLARRAAADHGAALADLADFGGARHVWPDHVHPTPLGQLEIARRAARALGEPEPDEPIGPPSPLAYARELARDLRRRLRERGQSPVVQG